MGLCNVHKWFNSETGKTTYNPNWLAAERKTERYSSAAAELILEVATPKSILSHPTLLALVIVIELASKVFAMAFLALEQSHKCAGNNSGACRHVDMPHMRISNQTNPGYNSV